MFQILQRMIQTQLLLDLSILLYSGQWIWFKTKYLSVHLFFNLP